MTQEQETVEYVISALKSDGYYFTSKPLSFPASPEKIDRRGSYYHDPVTGGWVCDCEEIEPAHSVPFFRGLAYAALLLIGLALLGYYVVSIMACYIFL